MNGKLDFIFNRRSVRKYSEDPLPEGAIRDLLEAAMAAPSAVARDPWRFVVVEDKATLESITDGLPNGQMLKEAKAGIVVCGLISEAHDNQLSYMLQDCSAAIENTLLAAAALGIGSCWLGVHPREERMDHLRDLLDIPEDVTPMGVISLGMPAKRPEPRTRYSESKVHREKW